MKFVECEKLKLVAIGKEREEMNELKMTKEVKSLRIKRKRKFKREN